MDKEIVAVVVPTIRPESFQGFQDAWHDLFVKHRIELVGVIDGKKPTILRCDYSYGCDQTDTFTVDDALSQMGKDKDLIYNFNDGVRNLGFAYVARFLEHVSVIITLDDDVRPIPGTDPIQDHLDALDMCVPTSWMSTTIGTDYMRGFPYTVRGQAEVVLSHGVWQGVPDWDAPTQLKHGNNPPKVNFYKGPIPRNVLFPMCIMNVAFKRKMLPYMYQAPAYDDFQRFSDIWGGINAKRAIDGKNWAAVTGYSTILHERASNVYANLKKEARGIGLNELYWKEEIEFMDREEKDYFENYHKKMKRWQAFIRKHDNA